jgi:hypothetical protein
MADEKIERAPTPPAAVDEPKTDGSKTENDAPSSNTAAEEEKTEQHKARPEREAKFKDLVVSSAEYRMRKSC